MGGTAVDTFATYACLQNTGTTFAINNALFLGNVKFKNSLVSLSDHYYVASTGTVTIKGNATIENANSSINFGNSGGTTVLDTNCRITIPAGSGTVNLTNVVQRGSDTISVPMSAGSDVLYLNTGNLFNGPFLFNGTRILLNGTTFNGTVNILRTYNGATFDICNGGNFFNGNTVICDSVNTSNSNRKFALAGTNPDDFNANVTFKQYASGTGASTVRFYPAYTKNSTFAGNITVESNTVPIEFGANGGKVILDGSGTQTLSKSGTYIPSFKRIQINKSSGIVSLGYPITLADTLFLTKGMIVTDTINLLTVPSGGVVTGATDSSFVSGTIAKIGNTSFTFPVGKDSKYRAIGIADLSTSSTFTAEYFHSNPDSYYDIDTKDSTLSNISDCEYWKLNRSGTANAKVILTWDSTRCKVDSAQFLRVARWDGTKWKNQPIGGTTGSLNAGSIISDAVVTSFGPFTISSSYPYCYTVLENTSSSSPSISCNQASQTWTDKYRRPETYGPSSNALFKVIKINFIIIQDDNGENNFKSTDNADMIRLNNIYSYIRSRYINQISCSDCIPPVPITSTAKKIDFELQGIYFYTNTQLNLNSNFPNGLTDDFLPYIVSQDPSRLDAINIFFNSPVISISAQCATGPGFTDLGVWAPGIWASDPLRDWATSSVMSHELAHCLGLNHTYNNNPCLSATDPDYLDDVFGMPWPGNCPHIIPLPLVDPADDPADGQTNNIQGGALEERYASPKQIGKMHRTLALLNTRKYVKCMYDSSNPWTISTDETWDFDIRVYNDIIVPNGVTLTLKCNVLTAAESKIVVESGGALILDGVTISSACDEMWQGIIVESGGTLTTTLANGCLIKDAQYAIEAQDGSTIRLINANFDNNYVGLYVAPGANNISTFITGCDFTCSGTLKDPYSGQAPTPGTIGFAGIEVHDLSLLSMPSSGGANTFNNLNYGVYSENSNVNIFRAQFSSINPYDPSYSANVFDPASLGSAVYAKGTGAHSLYFQGIGLGGATTNFEYCSWGVYADRVNTYVGACKMLNMRRGIKVKNGVNLSTRIGPNRIDAAYTGVELIGNDNAGVLTVGGNVINITNSLNQLGRGITVQEAGGINSASWIYNNQISMQGINTSSINGIELNSAEGYSVQHNDISLDDNGNQIYGISLTGSDESTLECNSITGSTSFSLIDESAVNTAGCLNYFYKCNYVDNTYCGFKFSGANWTTTEYGGTLESNYINYHYYGVDFTNSVIGNQLQRGNLWFNSPYSGEGVITSSINERFSFDIAGNWPLNVPSPFFPPGLFLILGGEADCGIPSTPSDYCVDPGPVKRCCTGGSNITTADLRVAHDSVHTNQFDEQTVWNVRRALMEKLMLDTSLVNDDTAITSFYNSHINDNIGELTFLKILADSINEIDSSTLAEVKVRLDIVDRNSIAIADNDSLILNDTTLNGDEIQNLMDENEERLDSINNATENNADEYAAMQETITGRATDLITGYDTVTATLDYEENEVATKIIYLSTVAQGNWQDVEDYSSELYAVALQCPLEKGNAVYQARSLYYLINDSLSYEDNNACADTCSVPVLVGGISGPVSGQCDQAGVSYSRDSVEGTVTSYTWMVSDTNYATVDTLGLSGVSVDFSDSVSSVVLFVIANNSCGSSLPVSLVILGGPALPGSISGNTSVCAYAVESYSTSGSSGATSYTWTVPSGSTILGSSSGASISLLLGASGGNVTVRAVNNCDTSDLRSLAINITCKQSQNVLGTNSVALFPNPTSGKATILYHLSAEKGILEISSSIGQVLQSYVVSAENTLFEFDTNDLMNGIYQYRLFDDDVLIGQGKMVILK